MMTAQQTTQLSKRLSWLLRHGATESGLSMDAAGWVRVDEVLGALDIGPDQLRQAVEENTKSRLQWDGDRLRACQGHSTQGTPVTADALERSWTPYNGAGPLWHGTALDVLEPIVREGLKPMARTHVHLAAETHSSVGKRANVDVMLEVDVTRLMALGQRVFESPNGVLLVRAVPPGAITGLVACTHKARARESQLRSLLAG